MRAEPANSEAATRSRIIDSKLRAAGWQLLPYRKSLDLSELPAAVAEFPTSTGPADYVLCLQGRILAVIEAKKLSLGPQNVLTQAERYAKALQFDSHTVPFLYSTNGEVIWHHDTRHPLNLPREIAAFHTPTALYELLDTKRNFAACLQTLAQLPNHNPRLRPYQREANTGIENAIAARRRMLIAMATGTGKTFTIVNEIYRLMKSGVARRVLFLVDRRALAVQAVRAFSAFDAEPGLKFNQVYEVYSQRFQQDDFGDDAKFDPSVLPDRYLLNPSPGSTFVYVSTIQRTAINLFGREAAFGLADPGTPADSEAADPDADQVPLIPIHAFDLIVADECHRGYTATQTAIYRRALDHFDAIKIGLTATPAAHTTGLFQEVVARYDYETAVAEGYLVDYDVVRIRSNVRMNGIFLNEGQEVQAVDPATGARHLDFLEDERQFDTSAIERDITAPDSNRRILEEIKTYALQHEQQTGRFPKTLIFAANDIPHTSHADQLVNLAREVFGRGNRFVRKITGRVDRPIQQIREFRNRPEPGIVVTADMLSTGVDIPDLEFIVFLRPIRSRILFTQMMGRGTRKGERHTDKSHFVVFDCFDGTLLAFFRNATDIAEDPPTGPTRTIAEIIEDIWGNRDRAHNTRVLVKRLQRIEKEMDGDARTAFSAFIPDGDMAAFARNLTRRLQEQFTPTMALLRNPAFQELLVHYTRRARTFLVSESTLDTVSSEWLVRGADGVEYKPADYLATFAQYIRTHESDIEAIAVLLKRPRNWSPGTLSDLKQRLAAAPQRFTVENLRRAHEVVDKKRWPILFPW